MFSLAKYVLLCTQGLSVDTKDGKSSVFWRVKAHFFEKRLFLFFYYHNIPAAKKNREKAYKYGMLLCNPPIV